MYSITYYVGKREVSATASSWQRALDKASKEAVKPDRRTPIVIKDDMGRVIHKIG